MDNLRKKSVGICGNFGVGRGSYNGQTVKTKVFYDELAKTIPYDSIYVVDTFRGLRGLAGILVKTFKAFYMCKVVVILPGRNGLRVMAPFCLLLGKLFKRRLIYLVIGGWLNAYANQHKIIKYCLQRFTCLFVESTKMKKELDSQGFKNIRQAYNAKDIMIIGLDEIKYTKCLPIRVCTFSRVMREKGIEIAIGAVEKANMSLGSQDFLLDIYGEIDEGYDEIFTDIVDNASDCISYKGIIPFKDSTKVIKEYDVLLFPSFYDGEGIPGTLIDAMSAGVPAVVSDWKYNTEMIKHGENGLVIEEIDVSAFSEALVWIKRNPDIWNDMKKNCIDEAPKYLPKNAYSELIEIIHGYL